MSQKVTVQLDADLLAKLRAQDPHGLAILSDSDLVTTLLKKELGEEIEVTRKPEPPSVTVKKVWIDSRFGLNVRAEPETGEVLEIAADEAELEVLDEKEDWLKVRTPSGKIGWVSSEFVADEKPPKGNVRGIHGSAGMIAPPVQRQGEWIDELQAMGMAWYKQLDAGDPNDVGSQSTFAWACRLKKNGIEPIIRYYMGQMFPGRLHDVAFAKMERYAAEGIVYCEIGNEPNLDHAEWQSSHHGRLNFNNPFYPRTIVENWIQDAEKAVAAGARPGFYALAPTDWNGGQHPSLSSVMFYRRAFEHVAAHPGLLQRMRRLFEPDKAWLAVHVSTYEFPVDFNPFPPGQHPHDMCLRGYEIPLNLMRDILGIQDVVVMSTEGGVFCKDSTSMNGHVRLNSHQEHAQKTVEMFDWIQDHSPLQAMCPWLICNIPQAIGHGDPLWAHDGWYDSAAPGFDPKPVVPAMKSSKPSF